jgi:HTH-type transcriptional regulator/antitoxin HigA
MKTTTAQIHRELAALRRGEQAPARVYRVTLDGEGRAVKRSLAPGAFQRAAQAKERQRGEAVEARRFGTYADVPKTYRELCQLYLPRPIHDAAEDEAATSMMNALAVFARLNADQRDYLEALTEFVDTYDQAPMKEQPWPEATGLDALKHLLAEHGLGGADLSRLLGGSRNLGAMILRGERNLTLPHIRKLAAHFKVSAELFL